MNSALRVLLVEDEDIIAMLTEQMLVDLGYELHSSSANLKDGLKAATEGGFDLGLLDVNLGGVESYPIADILTAKGIPLVFATGYSRKGIDSRFPHALTLQKPFTSEMLEQVLSRAFVNAKSGQ